MASGPGDSNLACTRALVNCTHVKPEDGKASQWRDYRGSDLRLRLPARGPQASVTWLCLSAGHCPPLSAPTCDLPGPLTRALSLFAEFTRRFLRP